MRRLGKTEAEERAELDDPRIVIQTITYAASQLNPEGQAALWIRLGELDLHPVENGVPEVLIKASCLIQPVRCDELNLLSLAAWDGDPNPRFGYEDSIRWMRRFDADSDWPSAENATNSRVTPPRPAQPSPDHGRLRNEIVPKTGWWHSLARPNGEATHYFEAGQHFPDWQFTKTDEVIWDFDPYKQAPPPKK